MSDIYLTLADGFEKLAAGYRALATESASVGQVPELKVATEEKQEPQITIEEVRAVLAAKSQEGKTREVKALLMKYDAGKLSSIKPEDYASLLKEAEVL
ncbi:hypothetical protein [Oceanobacillus massiliensis]|uniref:hypothetical protein n=1 Tax=Oceanobacillus massiliensis TaxID=1465765 RepID=UPI000287D031|nr:hypothetical protein [Oceanobacillus massiliensis]